MKDGADDEGVEESAERLVRAGWLAKGLLFVTIGLLGLDLARRNFSSKDADQAGALAVMVGAPIGRLLVVVVAVGLLLYAVWQMWSVVKGEIPEGIGSRGLSIARRIGMVGLGLSYGLLGINGLQIAWRGGASASGGGGGASPETVSSLLLSVPAGRFALIALGLGTVGVAGYHLWKGVSLDFIDDIDDTSLSKAQRRGLLGLGLAGFCSRAVMLAIAGVMFVISARKHDPERSAGLDESLRVILDAPFGRWLLAAASLGLVAAGLYDAVTFRRQELD